MAKQSENKATMEVQESAGSRWGVQLKKTATRTSSTSDSPCVAKNQRASLRHVSIPRRPQRRRSSSNSKKRWRCGGWKTRKAGTPFLGVALQPFPLKTIQEDEATDFFDLVLLGEQPQSTANNNANSQQSSSSCDSTCNSGDGEFAVRRKPGRRHSRRGSIKSCSGANGTKKTYQIDLNPDQEAHSGKDKSYLEVKARSVHKPQPEEVPAAEGAAVPSLKVTHHPELDKVELQLRHVVAPGDGGPRKIVTEAVFEIPLCKTVKPEEGLNASTAEPQPELLQISIQNLKADAVQLVVKQVDPDTREVFDMENIIDIKLTKQDPPKGWTMAVQLLEAAASKQTNAGANTTNCRWGNSASSKDAMPTPRRSKIVQKRIRYDLGDEDDWDDGSDDEQQSSDSLNKSIPHISLHNSFTPDSLHSKLQISSLSIMEDTADWWESENSKANAPKRPTRCHSPERDNAKHADRKCPCRDQSCKMPRRSSDDDGIETAATDELSSSGSRIPSPVTTTEPRQDSNINSSSSGSTGSSSSDEESDSGEDHLEPEPSATPTKEMKELTMEAKRDLLTLYGRMGCPTMQQMKDRVVKMGGDLKPEDVDSLPWMAGGRFMNVREMNQMYIGGRTA